MEIREGKGREKRLEKRRFGEKRREEKEERGKRGRGGGNGKK